MQQYPRLTPRAMLATSAPQQNLGRPNNYKDQLLDRGSDFETISYTDRVGGDGVDRQMSPPGERTADQSKNISRLKQITQRFFTKAALTIISSRVVLPQSFVRGTNEIRNNKWFNLVLDESDVLAAEVAEWATFDVTERQPHPLLIEIYLDTAELARNRTLVVVDDRGNKWDVCKNLDNLGKSSGRAGKGTQVILERWKISLGDRSFGRGSGSADSPPNIYKKAVVLFRALYTYIHLMPAWRFGRRIAKEPATLTSLRPLYRIVHADPATKDSLTTALYPSAGPTTETRVFEPTKSPVGSLSVEVKYRRNCNFLIDDADALLSSHFRGLDNSYSRQSLGDTSAQEPPGSLPVERKWARDLSERGQTYGSLSTFHREGHRTGTSPLSALRAASNLTLESPSESPPQKLPPDHRTMQSSKSSLKSIEGAPSYPRRVSVSFQPFKAGSLSSSPAVGLVGSPSSGSFNGGTSDISKALAQTRNRTSLNALPQTALRVPLQANNDVAVGSPSSISPKAPPITRYSSSFSHRKSRVGSSSGGGVGGRGDEDYNNSLKGSQSSSKSSNQPGSGMLAEGGGASPGATLRDDAESIADFLKLLDQKKDLPSLRRTDNTSRQTVAALLKFQQLASSHSVLGDSMSSSMAMQHRSSSVSTSSRAPPLLGGNSVSTASSPGKPNSPHTPHYPLIPSRLSANATIDQMDPRTSRSQARQSRYRRGSSTGKETAMPVSSAHGSTPMDIPTSPQRYPNIRRSSSAVQRRHASEDLEEFGLRSTTLPVVDRPIPSSLSELLLHEPTHDAPQTSQRTEISQRSESRSHAADVPLSSSIESHESSRRGGNSGSGSIGPQFKPHLTRGGGRGSPSSFGGGSGESSRAGRYSFSARPGTVDDDEPLVFTMSEIGAQSKRSTEEGEAGTGNDPGEQQGGGEGARRGNRRGASMW